jgi:hypothetical protein
MERESFYGTVFSPIVEQLRRFGSPGVATIKPFHFLVIATHVSICHQSKQFFLTEAPLILLPRPIKPVTESSRVSVCQRGAVLLYQAGLLVAGLQPLAKLDWEGLALSQGAKKMLPVNHG